MNNLAVALNADGQHAEAAWGYQRAVDVRPVYPEAYSNLGVALVAMGRIPQAIEHYREALRVWPDYAEADNFLGASLAEAGRLDEAITHFERALAIKGNDRSARENLARARALRSAPRSDR